MPLTPYNAYFVSPPENPYSVVDVSSTTHPAILSIFSPTSSTIKSIFVLARHSTSSTGSASTYNNLTLSIIELDAETGYLPAEHTTALSASSTVNNKVETYINEIKDGLFGYITQTNIYNETGVWVEFEINATNLDTEKNYGIFLSDTSTSSKTSHIFYTDKPSNTDVKQTYYLDKDDRGWYPYLKGTSNVQLCIAYATTEITGATTLDYGTITLGGPLASRNYGIGLFLYNNDANTKFTVNNWVPSHGGTGVQAGPSSLTYNSNYKWKYSETNTLPATLSDLNSLDFAHNIKNIELKTDDFIFFYQENWTPPLPEMNMFQMQIYGYGYGDMYLSDFPTRFFDDTDFALNYDTYLSNAATVSTYPYLVYGYGSLYDLDVIQDLENLDYNTFKVEPYQQDYFTDSYNQLELDSSIFADNNTKLVARKLDVAIVYDSTGIQINSDSDSKHLYLENTLLYPDATTEVYEVANIRKTNIYMASDNSFGYNILTNNMNNTIQLENINEDIESSYANRLVFTDTSCAYPPHLILRAPNAAFKESYSLILCGLSLFISNYSAETDRNNMLLSSGNSESLAINTRFSINDPHLVNNAPNIISGVPETEINVYGKGFALTLCQDETNGLTSFSDGDFGFPTEFTYSKNSVVLGAYRDRKYLIRHIKGSTITVEGLILYAGLCNIAWDSGTNTLTVTMKNKIVNSNFNAPISGFHKHGQFTDEITDLISSANEEIFFALNPFGLLFDSDNAVTGVYNDGDPILLIRHPNTKTSSDIETTVFTWTNIDPWFWNKLFPTSIPVSSTTYYKPSSSLDIPFYIVQTPNYFPLLDTGTETAELGNVYGYGWDGLTSGYQYDTYFGAFTDFLSYINLASDVGFPGALDNLFMIGPFGYDLGPNPTKQFYDPNGQCTLPIPATGNSISYSITLPYFTSINKLSELTWISKLINIPAVETLCEIKEGNEISIFENPVYRFRNRSNSSYEIIKELTSSEKPQNIVSTIDFNRFTNDNDTTQIFMTNNVPFNKMAFTYKLDETSSPGSDAKFELLGTTNYFIAEKDNPLVTIVPDINLGTSDINIYNTNDNLFFLDFKNPVTFTGLLFRKVSGNGKFLINNLTLFNDEVAVYGNCISPYNIFHTKTTEYTYIPPDTGYMVIDMNESKYVHSIEFKVYDSSGNEFSVTNPLFVRIMGLDTEVDTQFHDIAIEKSNKSKTQTSYINAFVQRNVKYLLIQPYHPLTGFRLNNIKIKINNLELPYLVYGNQTMHSLYPSISGIDVCLNKEKIFNLYQDESNIATFRPGTFNNFNDEPNIKGDSIFIPIGRPATPFSMFDTTTHCSEPSSVNMVIFNLLNDSLENSTNDSFEFDLSFSAVDIPDADGDFTDNISINAKPYQRFPSNGFYNIYSIDDNIIYLNSNIDDTNFSLNGYVNHVVRLNANKNIFAIITESGINNDGRSYIKVSSPVTGLNIQSGDQLYIERSNIAYFPSKNKTWLKLTYMNEQVPVNVFGLKVFSPLLDSTRNPMVIESGSLAWKININYT